MRRFLRSRAGLAGLGILAVLILLGALGPLLLPFPDAGSHWHDITYWEDSPAAVPPAWTAPLGKAGKSSRNLRLQGAGPVILETEGGGQSLTWRFGLASGVFTGPRDLVLVLPGQGQIPVRVMATDFGGRELELARRLLDAAPGQPARLSLSVAPLASLTVTEYRLPGKAMPAAPLVLLPGKVAGLLGTDTSKRDILTGIVLGLRWALILGVAVSFLTVLTGIILGVVAACYGGWVDTLISRVYEFFSLMPILPFMIVLSAVYKPSLWTFAGLALLFFWTKSFKPIYAMALRIREEGYIEAGKSMGTGRAYRVFRYVLPGLLPYGFAVMALSVPGIIIYEAGISLLGLGDSSVVTWGQMLHDAFSQGAVINRLWWWILPPGLMIGLTGTAFALIGRGLDRVWNPKAR